MELATSHRTASVVGSQVKPSSSSPWRTHFLDAGEERWLLQVTGPKGWWMVRHRDSSETKGRMDDRYIVDWWRCIVLE